MNIRLRLLLVPRLHQLTGEGDLGQCWNRKETFGQPSAVYYMLCLDVRTSKCSDLGLPKE